MSGQAERYAFEGVDQIQTPALLIYPEMVEQNIQATLRLVGGDPERWRPHIKTAKLAAVIRQMIGRGVKNFKCSTTLELLTACEAGAEDVLLAFPVTGANARRTAELAQRYSGTQGTRVSVLVEAAEQARQWLGTGIGVFIDVNSGMNRTGVGQELVAEICELAKGLGDQFRGLHYYDGHVKEVGAAHAGYDRLLGLVGALAAAGCKTGEVITSGTPAAPFAMSHAGLGSGLFRHRISPGTVIYNDMTSLGQLTGFGHVPAALVLTTVVSHPSPGTFTCDAGHKSVSADAGVPTCEVLGRPDFRPLKPSEEHLPMSVGDGACVPAIGCQLYLLPRHVCPTVNNFDDAVVVVAGKVRGMERVTARGHESPLVR